MCHGKLTYNIGYIKILACILSIYPKKHKRLKTNPNIHTNILD